MDNATNKSIAGQFLKPKSEKRQQNTEKTSKRVPPAGFARPDLAGPALPVKIQQMLNKHAHGLKKIVVVYHPGNVYEVSYFTDKDPNKALTLGQFEEIQRADRAAVKKTQDEAADKAVLGKIRDRLLIQVPTDLSIDKAHEIVKSAGYEKLAEGIMGWPQSKYQRLGNHTAKVTYLRNFNKDIQMYADLIVPGFKWNPLTSEERAIQGPKNTFKVELDKVQAALLRAVADGDEETTKLMMVKVVDLTKKSKEFKQENGSQTKTSQASAATSGSQTNRVSKVPPRPDSADGKSAGSAKADLSEKKT